MILDAYGYYGLYGANTLFINTLESTESKASTESLVKAICKVSVYAPDTAD
ncbi:hypothetical protein GCM10028808_36740 [Spirosoma migulaei]